VYLVAFGRVTVHTAPGGVVHVATCTNDWISASACLKLEWFGNCLTCTVGRPIPGGTHSYTEARIVWPVTFARKGQE
jgi:hypothetical protein